MARRPDGVEREAWLAERARVWRRRNQVLNALMAVVVVVLVVRYCA